MEPFEFPAAFGAVDRASIAAQARFLRATRLQLALLVIAGGSGAFTITHGRLDLAALVAGVALVAAAGIRLAVIRSAPHRRWYRGRAAAESIKTLSWRYAVGGSPFPVDMAEASSRFAEQVREVLVGLDRAAPDGAAAPTRSMDQMRAGALDVRRAAYRAMRIEDQIGWYSGKAAWNRRRQLAWSIAVLGLQVAAAVGAFLKAFGVIDIDLLGLAAALAASMAAWQETRQHGSLAAAYVVAAGELREIRAMVETIASERDWTGFVADAEEAISREHTTWKASAKERRPASLT
jgi:hypothetical protein